MPSKYEYLMPDYYPHFSCKMGACRTSCCEGWRVSISEDDYFRLLGMECAPEIRRRLDCCLHVLDGATPDRYAEISHSYEGNCQLHLPDGRCIIQGCLGEDSLPLVCKLYPRAYRNEGDRECSCTGSCERVVEILMNHPEPLKFIKRNAEFEVPDDTQPTDFAETMPNEQALRLFLISIVQERDVTLDIRLFRLGTAMQAIQNALDCGVRPSAEAILGQIHSSVGGNTRVEPREKLNAGLAVIKKMMSAMGRHGATLNAYAEQILEYFTDGDVYDKYGYAVKKFESQFPKWESLFENLLVNHMFFDRFPFSDGKTAPFDEFLAIGMIYTSMRFLSVGWMAFREKEEDLVDILAAAYRLFEHTPFHPYAANVLHREKFDTPEDIHILMSL